MVNVYLSTGLKRVRLFGMCRHFFPENLARGILIRVGMFIRDTIVFPEGSQFCRRQAGKKNCILDIKMTENGFCLKRHKND